MNEFDLISEYFKPLASGFPGALGLTDDAALLTPPPGCEIVITKDALSVGVHFIGNEDAALIAQKALRTNLSDLAAMGATPLCYFLALILPKDTTPEWIVRFAQGLSEDQKTFGITLAGGDTTATQGLLSISITALGSVPTGAALKRGGAKPGDRIYVSGTLGDSALGLSSLQQPFVISAKAGIQSGMDPGLRRDDKYYLEQRYLLPQPRITLGVKLRDIATSCMDISDGLVQDLGHICRASQIGATLHSATLPLSDAAKNQPQALETALSGGDDYELLFTVPAKRESAIASLAKELQLPLTHIGEITAGNDITILDANGGKLTLEHKGFQHFF